mmetsp:Transcript_246/g.717  ORF Transcript_246/g.717 Transcript_246/m.717 type:complete len:203 (-) Transcript_246:253-861(-)
MDALCTATPRRSHSATRARPDWSSRFHRPASITESKDPGGVSWRRRSTWRTLQQPMLTSPISPRARRRTRAATAPSGPRAVPQRASVSGSCTRCPASTVAPMGTPSRRSRRTLCLCEALAPSAVKSAISARSGSVPGKMQAGCPCMLSHSTSSSRVRPSRMRALHSDRGTMTRPTLVHTRASGPFAWEARASPRRCSLRPRP